MIKRRVLIAIILLFLQIGIVSARTVEYKYYFTLHETKNIQTLGTLQANKDINFKDYTYQIDINYPGNTIIPKYTPFEQKLIGIFGISTVQKFFDNGIIVMGGISDRFLILAEDKMKEEGKYLQVNIADKQELITNMRHKRVIRIESDYNQSVTFKLYPFSPEYYTIGIEYDTLIFNNSGSPDSQRLLSLYDSTQEYYNITGEMKNNIIALEDLQGAIDNHTVLGTSDQLRINKKYEIINFKRKTKNQDEWISKSLIPYYEFTVDVIKGMNDLHLTYETYQFPNKPLQIK